MARNTTKVIPLTGWILIAQEENPDTGERIRNSEWHVAWFDVFTRKHEAIRFARQGKWNKGYRAVRGQILPI